jgi:hypothetical protein
VDALSIENTVGGTVADLALIFQKAILSDFPPTRPRPAQVWNATLAQLEALESRRKPHFLVLTG